MSSDFSQYYEAQEPGQRERAYGWATAIGLQAVDGLSPSQNLIETAKRHIEGEISAAEARRIVDAYYETRLSPEYLIGLHGKIFEGVFPHAGEIREVDLTKREWVLDGESVHYEASFFIEKSLDYDFGKEEYGSPASDAIKNLHRRGAATVEKTVEKTVENSQSIILSALAHFPASTQKDLQAATGLSRRGVEWNLKSLKSRGLIRRVGPSRGGHWEVCQ